MLTDCHYWCVETGPKATCGDERTACVMDIRPWNDILTMYNCNGDACTEAPCTGQVWSQMFACETVDTMFDNWRKHVDPNNCAECATTCEAECS